MTANLEEMLSIAHRAVDVARDLLITHKPGELTAKGDRDFTSDLDFRIEAAVRELLSSLTPGLGFLGEEHGFSGVDGPACWVLDPIDGTANFVRDIPLCAISLALVEDGWPQLGVVDLPFLGTRYSAAEHLGAYRDGGRLRVRESEALSDAIVAIGDYAVGNGAHQKNRRRLRLTEQLAEVALRVRMTGSAALDLAWVAEGRLDASITLSNNPWDMAAGVVLAREAGAEVTDIDGSPYTLTSQATLAFSPTIGSVLLPMVRRAADDCLEKPS